MAFLTKTSLRFLFGIIALFSILGFSPGQKVVSNSKKTYVLEKQRGKGSFGEVWEVRGPSGEQFAMKFYLDPKKGHSHVEHAQQLIGLDEPHLIKVYPPEFVSIEGSSRIYEVLRTELGESSLADLAETEFTLKKIYRIKKKSGGLKIWIP